MLETNEVVFGAGIYMCATYNSRLKWKFSPNIIKTLQLMYLMISKLGVYLLFFLLFVVGFSKYCHFVFFGQDQNSSFTLYWESYFSQFDQATSGANFDMVQLTGEENVMWHFLQIICMLFTILTVIVLMNLVIAVVTSAYEEGVEQSSSWWAFTQLTMIHEDDFKDSTTSPKQRLKSFLLSLIKCNGKEESNKDEMQKLDKILRIY